MRNNDSNNPNESCSPAPVGAEALAGAPVEPMPPSPSVTLLGTACGGKPPADSIEPPVADPAAARRSTRLQACVMPRNGETPICGELVEIGGAQVVGDDDDER